MSAWPGSSEAATLVTPNAGLSKRSTSRTGAQAFSQPAGRTSLHLAEGSNRPNSTGVQQGQPRAPTGLTLDTQDEDGFVMRVTQSSQSGHARDSPLRSSKDGRPASRPSAALQSPYLQPPSGRTSQASMHRPNSRQQSQQSPQPQHAPAQPSPTPAPAAASGSSPNPLRRSTNSNISSNGAVASANGARIFQAYAAPPQRPLQAVAPAGAPQPGAQPSQKSVPPQPQPQPPAPSAHSRPNDPITPQPHHQQQHHHQQQQQQQSRAIVAQQQQQQAGPRATTALSGARSMQRVTGTGAAGSPVDGVPTAGQQAAAYRLVPALGSGPAAVAGPGPGAVVAHSLYAHHNGMMCAGSGGLRDGEAGAVPSTSFGYDDIPEEDEGSVSPVASNTFSGLTLEQYMQRMVTTPASAAATSGLGVSADSEESAPCSPGNASTRTEEEDSPYSSPAALKAMGRYGDAAVAAAARRAGGGFAVSPAAISVMAGGGMPRLGTAARTSAASGTAVRTVMASSVASQRVGSGGAGGSVSAASVAAGPAATPAAVAATAAASAGMRNSVTNPSLQGRGSTGVGGAPARSGGSGAPPSTSSMYEHDLSGSGADVSALLDGGSSDDDPLNPTALLDSSRGSRRLSSRASAMAFSNSLDLRPATAAVVSSSSMSRGDPGTPRSLAMAADTGNHHAIIKQVDLGGLSASLFTPNPNSGREASSSPASTANNLAASADLLMASNPPSPDIPPGRTDRRIAAGVAAAGVGPGAASSILRPSGPNSGDHAHVASAFPSPGSSNGGGGGGSGSSSGGGGSGAGVGLQKVLASPKTSMAAIPPPWGVSAREGAFGGGPAGEGANGAASLQALAARPLSSRGRPGAVVVAGGGGDGVVLSPGSVAAAAAGARPPSSVRWAKPQQQQIKSETAVGPPVMELPPEARLLAAQAQGLARPPTRQVQSARPPGSRGEVELDPSVWQANIAMQLQRPPSRQKPPPEALHLWTPEQQRGMLASGAGLGRPGGGARSLGARPQSAAPATYRGSRPTSGPSVKAQGPVGEDVAGTSARPPSRQKPPPLSTLLEHDDFPPPPRRQRPGAEQMDVVVSCSSGEEDDDDDDDLDL